MSRTALLLVLVATLIVGIIGLRRAAGQVETMVPAAGAPASAGAAPHVTEIPQGYRDWRLISIAHEEGNLHSIGALLGNDRAYEAFRTGKLPYPEGSVLAALHYKDVLSDENNKVFGQEQSHVAGTPTNIQFMVKDTKKYAATGGWGYGHFSPEGKPGTDAQLATCFPCHQKATREGVFSTYAP